MTETVLDTSIVIDLLRGSGPAHAYVAALRAVPICSEITRTEVLRGVRSSERRPTESLLASLRWCPVDASVSRRAGEIGRRFRRSHAHLGAADLLIAATADVLDAEFATLNVRHFPHFPGLSAPY